MVVRPETKISLATSCQLFGNDSKFSERGGKTIEIAPPERIFGDEAGRYTRIGTADDLMEATTRGLRVARDDASS
jgi:hypothetical protein